MIDTGGQQLRLLSCVLRNSGQGWGLIVDEGHEPTGITGVIQHPTYLELTHDVGAVRVSSMQVTPDEYYAARGIRVGASVGLPWTKLFLYSGTSTTPLNPASLSAASGNLWVTGYVKVPAPATCTTEGN
ncbi:hypothetical protein ACIGNW_00315 [Streptomyces sp. NPDC053707]|uniref:hypothetical protein n=1 Tax=Streptomyces sp. NPDC053707 TaxID=3365712 RepID=UPI0037CFDC88